MKKIVFFLIIVIFTSCDSDETILLEDTNEVVSVKDDNEQNVSIKMLETLNAITFPQSVDEILLIVDEKIYCQSTDDEATHLYLLSDSSIASEICSLNEIGKFNVEQISEGIILFQPFFDDIGIKVSFDKGGSWEESFKHQVNGLSYCTESKMAFATYYDPMSKSTSLISSEDMVDWSIFELPEFIPMVNSISIYNYNNNEIAVASRFGLWHFDGEEWTNYSEESEIIGVEFSGSNDFYYLNRKGELYHITEGEEEVYTLKENYSNDLQNYFGVKLISSTNEVIVVGSDYEVSSNIYILNGDLEQSESYQISDIVSDIKIDKLTDQIYLVLEDKLYMLD